MDFDSSQFPPAYILDHDVSFKTISCLTEHNLKHMGNATSWLTQSLCPIEQALWVAAKSGDLETLQKGLERLTPETRFHAEWRDPVYGYSPLANACSQGHFHCAQALLAYGVDANARDAQGNTPLHIATSCGKSEIVRLLLETPAVDYFAKTATKAQTLLDIARQGYKVSEEKGLQYIQCVEHIEKKLCLYSGWLYERSDNFLSIASGISGLDSWKKRYAMALRTDVRDVIEIDLFPMKPGERRPPVPSLELLYKTSDGIQQSDDVTWLNRKEFRLSLKVTRKHGSSRSSAVHSMDFAAVNQEELAAWKTFLTTLRVNAPASSATTAIGDADSRRVFTGSRRTDADSRRTDIDSRRIQSSQPAACCSSSCSPTQAAILQETRDLERALQLSLEEARRHSRTQSAPSAPPPSDTMLEALNYSGTVVGPDGVEIVQLLGGDDLAVAHRTLSPPSASSHLVTSAEWQEAQRQDECVICFDRPQEAVCVPCGHNAVCMSCAQELLDTTGLCPVCRQQVREVIRLYRV